MTYYEEHKVNCILRKGVPDLLAVVISLFDMRLPPAFAEFRLPQFRCGLLGPQKKKTI